MPATKAKTKRIIELLIQAYNAELETVMNFLANAANLDGVRAEEIRESLEGDIAEEIGHAQKLAARIRTLEGTVPGSQSLKWTQDALQPRRDSTDVVSVIKGVIGAEEAVIAIYDKIIKACDGVDYVTQDLATELMGEEQEHRREFIGFLREYE
ncbi:MAG: rubrerythrin [Planctomycetes bacterium]|nr:rubrerythrin [Planctomycetota bacterium]